ncbi:ComF family protein [Alteromonas sp. BMJM2]|uniref:ComF family protein n=1 Tax=Alteromonas sp. BMJM2 TaxID=2954241 RepID=UPI0022B4C6A5|nr:ComF family protein [Alteromonas sp. BMJM2]
MNLSCLLCYQASPAPVCQWCESDLFFFNDDIHGNNLLKFGPVGRHVTHRHYHSLSILSLHTWPMSSLIHQFKFNHSLAAGKMLNKWFVDKKQHCTLSVPDLLLPVPISAWRLAKRHYNQAGVMAEFIGKDLGIPCLHQWAIRTGASSQHQLSKSQRKKNAEHAFALTPYALNDVIAQKSDKFVVAIVDDVVTTGVTVDRLSRLLVQRFPQVTIQVWAMTFTPPPKSTLYQST